MTYKNLLELIENLNQSIVAKSYKKDGDEKETKIVAKLRKVYEKVKPHHEDYEKQLEELRIDNASVDDKGVLLKDEKGGYKFGKDGLKNLMKQTKELLEKEFEFSKIQVVNPAGLEEFSYLSEWLSGVDFAKEEEL